MSAKIRLKTVNGKQIGSTILNLDGSELCIREFQMEYFDKNELELEDGDYPEDWFENVIIAANIVPIGESTPVTTYRGMKLKKEYRKYKV